MSEEEKEKEKDNKNREEKEDNMIEEGGLKLVVDSKNNNEEEEEYIEVEKPKVKKIFQGDQDQRILQEIQRKELERKMAFERIQKNALKKKKSEAINDRKPKSATQLKKQRIFQKITPQIKLFKALNSPNHSDTQCSKFRYEQKQKLFKNLLYTIEELQGVQQCQLSEEELRIMNLPDMERYNATKSITTQIDIDFLYILNNGNKQVVSRNFRNQWKELTQNIQDQDNLTMRRRIITKQWQSKQIAKCAQSDFYSDKKKQYIREENDRLLSQAAKIQDKKYLIEEEPAIEYNSDYRTIHKSSKTEIKKKKQYKYLQTTTMFFLKDLISKQKIIKMKNILQDGLPSEIKDKLVKSIQRNLQANFII